MLNKYKGIAILSTVINFDLYSKTAMIYPESLQKIVIDGRKGMFGFESLNFFEKIKNYSDLDYLILADEDVVVNNFEVILEIIAHMKINNIHVVGPRDGGAIAHRNQNPYLMNTFFNIIDWQAVKSDWNRTLILKNQYAIENEFDDNLVYLPYSYDKMSTYEPYYCFYLWLRRRGLKFMFLESEMHSDGISNHLIFNNKKFLTHTWYARSYGVNTKHTNRINAILKNSDFSNVNKVKFKKHIDYWFALQFSYNEFIKSTKNKIKSAFNLVS